MDGRTARVDVILPTVKTNDGLPPHDAAATAMVVPIPCALRIKQPLIEIESQ